MILVFAIEIFLTNFSIVFSLYMFEKMYKSIKETNVYFPWIIVSFQVLCMIVKYFDFFFFFFFFFFLIGQ